MAPRKRRVLGAPGPPPAPVPAAAAAPPFDGERPSGARCRYRYLHAFWCCCMRGHEPSARRGLSGGVCMFSVECLLDCPAEADEAHPRIDVLTHNMGSRAAPLTRALGRAALLKGFEELSWGKSWEVPTAGARTESGRGRSKPARSSYSINDASSSS